MKTTGMTRLLSAVGAFALAAVIAAGCFDRSPAPRRVGAVLPPGADVIGFDPSSVGLSRTIGSIVYKADGSNAWLKTGSGLMAWTSVTAISGGGGTPDGGVSLADGGVAAPLSGNGTKTSPISLVIPDQTTLGNVSGQPAAAVGLTKAQELARLGITPFTYRVGAAVIRAQALAGSTLTVPICHEGDYSVGWVSTVSNGGSTALLNNVGGTAIACKTNASSSAGQCQVSWSSLSSPGSEIANAKTGPWYVVALVRISTAVDSSSEVDFQLNAADLGNTAFRIGQAGGKSTTHWRVFIADGSGATIVNAAVTQAIDTNWHIVEVVNDGTNITEYVDTVSQNANAVTAFASGNPLFPQLFVNNGSTNNREMDIDYVCTVVPSNSPISGQP